MPTIICLNLWVLVLTHVLAVCFGVAIALKYLVFGKPAILGAENENQNDARCGMSIKFMQVLSF